MSDAQGSEAGAGLRKWASRYTTVALIAFNALLWVAFRIRDYFRASPGPETEYSGNKLAAVYPEFTGSERRALLQETWSRPFVYEDFVHFKESPTTGKYVNVAAAGYRYSKDQGPWPPDPANLNVFVFGGSTTFGYGVADWQTVPSYLQEYLSRRFPGKRVCVYNFGAGYYYSKQERILFEKLLVEGVKPHIVVFMDGMNDCGGAGKNPRFWNRFQRAFQEGNPRRIVTVAWEQTPIGRLARFVRGAVSSERPEKLDEEVRPDNQVRVARIIPNYLANKQLVEAVCHQFGISPIFVWQPHPSYQYDPQYHLFVKPQKHWPTTIAAYEKLNKLSESGQLGKNFLWCANLQQDEKECLYVDHVHYTAKFSSKIAETISAMCFERKLIAEADSA